jgi:hypothetical protein
MKMKNILNVVALLILVAGGYVLYQQFLVDNSIRIVESIQHELAAAEEYVFSRDTMKFSETQNNTAFLAHVNYLYTWEADVPFGFSSKDLQLHYEKTMKRLIIEVTNLRLYPFQIKNQKDEKTSEFLWMNQGEPAQEFWKKINSHTETLINEEFQKDKTLVASVLQITKKSLTVSVLNILKKLNLSDIEVEIVIKQLRLYSGKAVSAEESVKLVPGVITGKFTGNRSRGPSPSGLPAQVDVAYDRDP